MAERDDNILPVRPLPAVPDAEAALLSAILSDNRSFHKVAEFLTPVHFSDSFLGKAFKAASTMIERGQTADVITLKSYLGAEYADTIARIAAAGVTIINAEEYGKEIFDRYLRRQLISVGHDIVVDAYEMNLDNSAAAQIEASEHKLYELSASGQIEGGPTALGAVLGQVLKTAETARNNPDKISGITTGFSKIDERTGGLHDSDLIVVAARPGMGKTALATCIAYNAADYFLRNNINKSVAFFSLEMSAEQLAGRILSTETHISGHAMRTGKISKSDFDVLAGAVRDFAKLPLYVDDTPGVTAGAIKTRARRLKRDKEKGLGLIVIDYIQLISGTVSNRNDGRVQEVSAITRALKIMAKELNVPVMALSQLSRKVEDRDDKRPQLSDLRESGSIEQDADIVAFIFREGYYLENKKLEPRGNETIETYNKRAEELERRKAEVANKAEFIIAKQRHGPTGMMPLYFNPEYTEFGNWDEA